ncbi:MAG: DUF1330 domain-containing protein [Sphingomonadaceae bacterium]|nr:DUF1330 domain-containing protein [Sphingomonadaceae bacterium]
MVAYILAIRHRVFDETEMARYIEKAADVPGPAERRFLALGGRCEVVEGPPAEAVILAEYPSFEEAKAWYHSEAYRVARAHREKGADFTFLIFEGCTEGGRHENLSHRSERGRPLHHCRGAQCRSRAGDAHARGQHPRRDRREPAGAGCSAPGGRRALHRFGGRPRRRAMGELFASCW